MRNTVIGDWVVLGLTAASFIVVLKWLAGMLGSMGLLPKPLVNVVGAI
jgi:hypothetical protein